MRHLIGNCQEIIILPSPIQIWPSCWFYVPSATRGRFQNRLKSRGGCATKMLHTEIIELLNASNKSTHELCIDRELRSFWVVWRLYHICRCSRKYILNNLIHQLHNVFLFRRKPGCTDSYPITDREFRSHEHVVRTHMYGVMVNMTKDLGRSHTAWQGWDQARFICWSGSGYADG